MVVNPATVRLLNQLLAGPRPDDPAEVVAHMGAMQAQDIRMMRWAVAVRTRKPSHEAFKQAFDAGRIIRLHLMRGTWQFVTAEDYGPFLDLCAPNALAVTKGWMKSNHAEISGAELVRVRDILARTAADKGAATKEDFAQALAEKDIRLHAHLLSYHVRLAEIDGILCSGTLEPAKPTYALAADRVKIRAAADRDEALARFTRKYFLSRQPATLEDFAWWSGLGVGGCKRGIAMLGNFLHKETWQGREFYLAKDRRTRGFKRGSCLLLPPYDEYLVGYKSRDIVLAPEHRNHAFNDFGIFRPVVARDGVICGNWSPYAEEFEAEAFDGPLDAQAVMSAWKTYRRFLP